MPRRAPIPFEVYHRPANTQGGEGWVVTIHPGSAAGGFPCEFGDWVRAAVFIDGLNDGRVDQSCFTT